MRINLPGCPELPELPPLFWAQYNTELAHWQKFFAEPDQAQAPIGELRAEVLAAIKRRLKILNRGGRKAGRALFELSGYLACLTVIDSRN